MHTPMDPARRGRALAWYFVLTYGAFLVNTATYFREVTYGGPLQAAFLAAVHVTYSLVYLLPALLLILAWKWILDRPAFARRASSPILLLAPAVVLFAASQMFFFADRFVFHLFGYHVNGFVWNVITTKGGIESMGGDSATDVAIALVAFGFLALEAFLAWVSWRLTAPTCRYRASITRRKVYGAVAVLVFIGLFERFTYGACSLQGHVPVVHAANAFPFYLPFTFRGIAKALGYTPRAREGVKIKADTVAVKYPLEPIRRGPHRKLNIVWLVSESLRWDMLDREIMPATWKFAERSAWFLKHYSGGNGTRMGCFSMFYGLYAPYWFPFLADRRGPVLIDCLLEDGYEFLPQTSARFTYPEFDKTIWARLPADVLHEEVGGEGWERDRRNVTRLLDFLERRDPARPFMTFLFFESPHARYHFPPEATIRRPYLEEFNYVTTDIEGKIDLIKNRYINSCHHLDTQIQRILESLESKDLLKDTIVLITGDHGEEFLEEGRWGHNCAFSEPQIRVPFVLWAPGHEPMRAEHITSHLDVPATICKLLGVENPERDYTLGHDLFGPERRTSTVLGDWEDVVYLDDEITAVFPLRSVDLTGAERRLKGAAKGKDPEEVLSTKAAGLTELMKDLRRFAK